jgi:hypothetical protein
MVGKGGRSDCDDRPKATLKKHLWPFDKATSTKSQTPTKAEVTLDALARPPAGLAPTPIRPSLATPEAGLRRFGNWLVLGLDSVGKRAACRCDCGVIRELSLSALESGATPLCDCARRRSAGPAIDPSPAPSYAAARWRVR